MCGIAGIIHQDRDADAQVLKRLAEALAHRGPDGVGMFHEGHVGILNTRLAIIDVAHGDQPFISPEGSALVANGEIYNDLATRAAMTDVPFKTGSDCEPPLYLYQRHGVDYARHLRGMYAIAIYDKARRRLILSRDPYGIKQLYYVQVADSLAFASEPQALIKAGLANTDVDHAVSAELMQLQFTTGADTIYPAIKRVLAGETLVIEGGRIVERHRLRPNEGAPATLDKGAATRELDRLMHETVALHVRADVPTGLFLSGGIDSSCLITVMSRLSDQPVVALTAAFPDSVENDESDKAKRAADAVGADLRLVNVTAEDFFAHAPQLAKAMDDPTADSSAFPIFMLARAAHEQGLKVVLSGEGADELFGGYKRYRRALWLFGMLPQKTRTRGVFNPFLPGDGLMAGWRDGIARAEQAEMGGKLSTLQGVQAVDCAEWLPNDLLLKLDRCLMAHSVEGRTPFLDVGFSPFAFGLSDDLKVRGNMGKWLLRDWLATNLPAMDPWSKKKGFIPPNGDWIAQYKGRIEPHLLTHPALLALGLQPAVRRVFADPANNPQAAWSLVFYALWYSHHILGVDASGTIEDVLDGSRGLAMAS